MTAPTIISDLDEATRLQAYQLGPYRLSPPPGGSHRVGTVSFEIHAPTPEGGTCLVGKLFCDQDKTGPGRWTYAAMQPWPALQYDESQALGERRTAEVLLQLFPLRAKEDPAPDIILRDSPSARYWRGWTVRPARGVR